MFLLIIFSWACSYIFTFFWDFSRINIQIFKYNDLLKFLHSMDCKMDHSCAPHHLYPVSFPLMFTLLINLWFASASLPIHSITVFTFFEIIVFKFLEILLITSSFLGYLIYLHPRNLAHIINSSFFKIYWIL